VEAIEKRDPKHPVAGMNAPAAVPVSAKVVTAPPPPPPSSGTPAIPPPPPEDALDPSFFDDNVMNMDSVSIELSVL